MHSILQRQLRKHLSSSDQAIINNESFALFVKAIDETYRHFDEDRTLIERSLEISSNELNQHNESLKEQSAQLKREVQIKQTQTAKIEAIISSIGEGIIETNLEGSIGLVNAKAAEVIGINEGELLRQNLFDIFAKQSLDKNISVNSVEKIARLMESNSRITDSFEFSRSEGKSSFLAVDITKVKQNETDVGFLVTLKDVTVEKQIDRIKTEFISIASHQLRTPLSAIKWYAEMLLHGDAGQLEGEQVDFTSSIYESTERMIKLVNTLLNVSKVETGELQINPEKIDLKEELVKVIESMKQSITAKSLNMSISTATDIPKLSIDVTLVKQILVSLVSNAIRYTPPKGAITMVFQVKEGNLVFEIKDTGFGIPKDQQPRVFQKFFRGDNVAKFDTEGVGLNLYLVKSVLQILNGDIWFESEENKGTTFWVTFPIRDTEAHQGDLRLDI